MAEADSGCGWSEARSRASFTSHLAGEVAVIQDSSGKTEEVEITREDTANNADNLEGSVLDDADTSTPTIESES